MKDKQKSATSQFFNFTPDSYLERTSRPIYAIIFLLPFIVFYEFGVIFIKTNVLNQSSVLVTAFAWLQQVLKYIGFAGKIAWIAPPLVVVIILISMQFTSRKSWRFYPGDIFPMAIESILLAVPLIVFSLFLNSPPKYQNQMDNINNAAVYVQHESITDCAATINQDTNNNTENQPLLPSIITGIGAGIYEELIFRLILICVLMLLFQDVLRFEHKTAIILSVLISAAMFSAHHHIDFINGQLNPKDTFSLTKFGFRVIAGIYFAILFTIRGFGITAGTHSFYDIIAVFINSVFFD